MAGREAAAALSGITAHETAGPPLRDVALAVMPGEIVTLLGGPGAGKSRLLRILAGFEAPAAGEVASGGDSLDGAPPGRRRIGLIEHGLGLFAHLTVAQTLALAARPRSQAAALLEAAGLEAAARRRPAALDAGQRAMLAAARALAASPRALLCDDTARGLDAAAQARLFALLRGARAAGVGVLYATCDAAQALALGDRIAVLADGAIRQDGPPQSVYEEPADAAVAALTGPVNMLPGQVQAETEDGVQVRLEDGGLVEARARDVGVSARCLVCLRPERLAVAALPPEQLGEGALPARVEWLTMHGDHVRLGLRTGNTALVAWRPGGTPMRGVVPGATVSVAWQPRHAMAFPRFSGLI